MRHYTVDASRHYKITVADCTNWRSSLRIRQFTVEIFRKYFGGIEPTFVWHVDGKFAGASDKRGNELMVHQHNWWNCFQTGHTYMPRPMCPMIISRH